MGSIVKLSLISDVCYRLLLKAMVNATEKARHKKSAWSNFILTYCRSWPAVQLDVFFLACSNDKPEG
jgi:hypothetical protein